MHRNPVWLVRPLGLDTVRDQASAMEVESRRFYERPPPARKMPESANCWTIWRRKSGARG